jgi:hypothetical protein
VPEAGRKIRQRLVGIRCFAAALERLRKRGIFRSFCDGTPTPERPLDRLHPRKITAEQHPGLQRLELCGPIRQRPAGSTASGTADRTPPPMKQSHKPIA